MLGHYLDVGIRNLLRGKLNSLLNVIGLSIGMACLLLAALFVQRGLRMNVFHEKGDRIHRILRQSLTKDAGPIWSRRVDGQLGAALRHVYPEIVDVVRISDGYTRIRIGDVSVGHDITYADPNVLDVFTFPLVAGDPETALKSPHSMLVEERTAIELFGSANPVGQVVTLEGNQTPGDFTITGVLREIRNSDLDIEVLISPPPGSPVDVRWGHAQRAFGVADRGNAETYLLLADGSSAADLNEKLPGFIESYSGAEVAAVRSYVLESLSDLHFGIRGERNVERATQIASIGFLVILIACLNFINLTTARSEHRAREIGLRKVIGARRRELAFQFLTENFLLVLISLCAALGLASYLLPDFNRLIRADLSLSREPHILLMITVLAAGVGFIASLFPSLFLSNLQPAIVKGTTPGRARGYLRKSLVILQFSLAIGLIVSTGVVRGQWSYMTNRPMGFDSDHLICVQIFDSHERFSKRAGPPLWKRYRTIKQTFLDHPGILKASAAYNAMFWGNRFEIVYPEGFEDGSVGMNRLAGDEDFVDVWGLAVVNGRDFNRDRANDYEEEFILNETAVRRLGWTDPIGKRFAWKDRKGTVIGVVEDFHTSSLKEPLEPAFIVMTDQNLRALWLKLSPGRQKETIDFVEETWEQFLPEVGFSFRFVDQQVASRYREELRFSRVLAGGASLAIFVACLGLLGLAAYVTEKKTKEVAVRRFSGASVTQIVGLLSVDLLKPIVLANVVAWPVTYWLMRRFLEGFPYRAALEPMVFVAGGSLAVGLGLATVIGLTVRVAREDLIETLRCE